MKISILIFALLGLTVPFMSCTRFREADKKFDFFLKDGKRFEIILSDISSTPENKARTAILSPAIEVNDENLSQITSAVFSEMSGKARDSFELKNIEKRDSGLLKTCWRITNSTEKICASPVGGDDNKSGVIIFQIEK